MFSFKGPGFRIFAAILAVIALGAGIYLTFFRSAGYEKTTATIVSIENDPDYIPDPNAENDVKRIVTVQYTANGKAYSAKLDSDAPSYEVGKTVDILYDPNNPAKISSGRGFGIYFMIAGAVILLLTVGLSIKAKRDVRKLKEAQGITVYAPSEQGEQREVYFLTDLGTPKYGHHIEDKDRRVLYEAKMTKFTPAGPFGFDFIDYEHGTTAAHLVGHQEETDWNSFLLDNHYTFSLDGEDIWKHLKKNGVKVESRFAEGKVLFPSYTVSRDGAEIGYIEASSRYVHEEDAEEHAVANKVPVPGFYRIFTSEKNLDLLFVVALAFARSGATDDKGGSRRILFNAIKG